MKKRRVMRRVREEGEEEEGEREREEGEEKGKSNTAKRPVRVCSCCSKTFIKPTPFT